MTEHTHSPYRIAWSELDADGFAALVEPHRRALRTHCYRMTGSLHDAEDMVQETFLRAWRSRETFEGRASLRAWLYKIATHACLDALKKRRRRLVPRTYQPAATPDAAIPAPVMEPIWLEPFPDEWLVSDEATPEEQAAEREHITLAFMTALHQLPPRQRAVLLLRDVLDWQASEVAALLDMSVAAVKSALHRARSTLSTGDPALTLRAQATDPNLAAYVRAWESADIAALLKLLKDDATFSMPPIPSWYRGRGDIGGLVGRTIFAGNAAGRWRLLATHANAQPAFGLYRLGDDGIHHAYGIQVLTMDEGMIGDIITFRVPELVARFGLPSTLEDGR